ncbi:MAG: hypothetical protein V4734_00420, partial [Terriglobus sp.]
MKKNNNSNTNKKKTSEVSPKIKAAIHVVDHVNNIAPEKFGSEHYLPILKPKAGEFWALARASQAARGRMTPVFEFHEPDKLSMLEHATKVANGIKKCWGPRPCFVDTYLLGTVSPSSAAAAGVIMGAVANAGITMIPVL